MQLINIEIGLILSIGSILLLVFCAYWFGYRHEKLNWNNGLCPRCFQKWKIFDTDSQGGRGYTCKGCDKTIWISYPIDKV